MQACGLTAAMESSRPGIYGMRIYGKPSRRDKFYLLMGLLICSCSLWGNSAGFSCSFPCLCDSHDNDRALLCCVYDLFPLCDSSGHYGAIVMSCVRGVL